MAAKKSNEIKITRIYDAPVKAVWDAWTDVDQVVKWWGPRGFTLTTHSKDLRPGGHWKYTMHGPDGTDYPNHTIYYEVEKYSRLVYDHGGNDDHPPLFRVTVTFADFNGKTKMDMTMALPTPEAAEESRKFIKKANGNSTWDRLAEYLEKESSSKEVFVINRSFEAPIEKMFEMWINPSHLAKWLPPPGMTMEFIRADIRAGGSSFYMMTNGASVKMFGRANYVDFQKPNLISYTQQFCDEKESVARHPLAPTWPETVFTVVTFAEEEPGCTRVTVRMECHGDISAEELATFIAGKPGMMQGWNACMDKLEEMLGT